MSFFIFHLVAMEPIPQPATAADLGSSVIHQMIHVGAMLLQFIVPAALLIGAGVSYTKRSRSQAIFNGVRNDPGMDVSGLSWQDFERVVGEGFRQRGFEVKERGGSGPDGGVDLALARGHERFLVQCKQWRALKVGVSVVRELYGVMAAEGVAGGYVVTSGTFTTDARAFASGRNIELIDGAALQGLLRDGRSAVVRPIDSMPAPGSVSPQPPSCPVCQTAMVLRTAKQGSRKGHSFWGCARYPQCRAIVGIG